MFAFKNTCLDLSKLNNKSFAPIWVSAPLSLALLASSFQLGVSHGALAMTLKQPIYFEQGDLHVNVPVKRQAGGKVVFEARDFALRSPHRPWELELLYGDGDARVGLKMEKHAGHPVQTLFGYMRRF